MKFSPCAYQAFFSIGWLSWDSTLISVLQLSAVTPKGGKQSERHTYHVPSIHSFLILKEKISVIYGIRPRVISSPKKKKKNINVFNHSFTFFECFMVRYIVLHTIWNVNYQCYYLVNIQEWLCVSLHFELVLYRDIFSWNHIDHFTVNVYSHNLHSPWCSQHIIDTSLVPINY